MVLTTLQRHLETLYEVSIQHQVMDFLITDAEIAHRLENQKSPANCQERLLILQTDEAVEVALYIDDAVLESLAYQDPFKSLHSKNINDFLIALEGVSHFLYLLWNAGYEKQVTPLEMELQAEIDKYITAGTLFQNQRVDVADLDLHRLLFANPVFDAELDEPSLLRYRDANRLASLYCRQLASRYRTAYDDHDLVNELRRFYRLPRNGKVRKIVDVS